MKNATLQRLSQHPCIVAFFFLPQTTRTAVPTVAPLSAVCERFRGGLVKVPHPPSEKPNDSPVSPQSRNSGIEKVKPSMFPSQG